MAPTVGWSWSAGAGSWGLEYVPSWVGSSLQELFRSHSSSFSLTSGRFVQVQRPPRRERRSLSCTHFILCVLPPSSAPYITPNFLSCFVSPRPLSLILLMAEHPHELQTPRLSCLGPALARSLLVIRGLSRYRPLAPINGFPSLFSHYIYSERRYKKNEAGRESNIVVLVREPRLAAAASSSRGVIGFNEFSVIRLNPPHLYHYTGIADFVRNDSISQFI